jgi:hypothetical protein
MEIEEKYSLPSPKEATIVNGGSWSLRKKVGISLKHTRNNLKIKFSAATTK